VRVNPPIVSSLSLAINAMMTFRPDQNGLWLLCGSLWWAIQFCGGLAWTSAQTLNYTLEFSSAPQHYVGVQVEFDVDADHVEVMMPTWTPGSYLIREYPRFVQELRAVGAADEDSQTQDLAVTKTRKNRWQIATAGVRRVTLRYQVYCHELSVRTNWVDNDLAVLNGAATFLVPLDQRQQPIQVQVQLPPGWARSVCALPNDAERPHTYIAENYDQLVDSPILAGNCQIFPFQVGGINHYLVNLGDDALWDGQKAANDLKKVVAAQHEFWGQIPYPEYYFLNVVMGGGGGLEHDNSTLLMSGRRTMQSPQSYRRWLSLCSHEFFHAWNVRRLRPRSLVQYDYENEVYTRELWVAEGLTSYYQNLLLARAGLMTPNELLQSLSADIRGTENRPGNLVQSLAESSFDSWIDFYRPHENSANTSVSYYGRGSVAGFLLDAEIRRRSNGAANLDDAMVKLYQQCLDGGYTNQDLQEVCQQLTDSDFGPWFQTYIDSATAFDYTPALELWGLRFAGPQGSGNRGEDAGRDATRPGEERPLPVTIGVTLRDSDGQTQVSAIRAGSTGQAAGLNLDDEVLAVNGRRVNAASFAEELKAVPPGEWMTVLVARRGILREIRVEVATNPTESWRLARVPKPTADQEQRWQQWLQGKPVQASETETSETAIEGAENSAETEID
jgi:predicted metalloprotease with PDZ domain